ncbi:hypothetical protein [Streptomyces sp. CA-132043]|uniref:hypothetical protein n=1 Tax=Streptomyces sp. CA-132043 TaxID=3240048 RepID=UPI003D8C600E
MRERPFASVNPRRYVWAEHRIQEMLAAIVDVAAELAERCLADRDPCGTLWAARQGARGHAGEGEPDRLLFQAYAAVGDMASLERAAQQLDHPNEELGVELEDATAELPPPAPDRRLTPLSPASSTRGGPAYRSGKAGSGVSRKSVRSAAAGHWGSH